MQTTRIQSLPTCVLALTLALPLGACSEAETPPVDPSTTLEGPFVPIYRERSPESIEERRAALSTAGLAADASSDFYLAIKKSELQEKWFLSAFLSQVAPNGVASGAAQSLGTRVVSFKVQNGKLFVFDVADDKIWSDTFRPEVVLEAYPIVQGFRAFEQRPGASDYLLFDPAAGLNRFRLLQDSFLPIEVALSFSQRFRAIPDGVTFDQVFSGVVRAQIQAPGSTVAQSPPSLVGTLSLALRRYREGEGYTPTAMPARELYFRSPAKLVPNEGTRAFVAAKWNIHAGGAPIVWKIAPFAATLGEDPRFADVDIAGALEAGIESWNEAFGFPAIEAELAAPEDAFGDDDVNYFIFDPGRAISGAFANWRSNPNTGEIRGASVYFSSGTLRAVGELLPTPPPPPPGGVPGSQAGTEADGFVAVEPRSGAPRSGLRLGWGETADESLCDLDLPTLDEVLAAAPAVSRKDKIERFLGHIAAHEVGHTLGLRHNFKGSLRPPSSSVMEYVAIDDTIAMGPHPGSYDVAAIRYLYGLSAELPQDPFCNDGEADVVDPDCRRFDVGVTPLTEYWVPRFREGLIGFLSAKTNSFLSPNALAPHMRLAKVAAVRLEAYEGAMGLLRAPATPPVDPPPADYAARLNLTTQLALRMLFLDPQPGQTVSPGQPLPAARPPAEPVLQAAVSDLGGLLVNQDGLRNAATQRLAVDVLKRFQHPAAYTALAQGREAIAAQLPGLEGDAAVAARDLLNRIDRALAAYFD
jgi:Met-zincin